MYVAIHMCISINIYYEVGNTYLVYQYERVGRARNFEALDRLARHSSDVLKHIRILIRIYMATIVVIQQHTVLRCPLISAISVRPPTENR